MWMYALHWKLCHFFIQYVNWKGLQENVATQTFCHLYLTLSKCLWQVYKTIAYIPLLKTVQDTRWQVLLLNFFRLTPKPLPSRTTILLGHTVYGILSPVTCSVLWGHAVCLGSPVDTPRPGWGNTDSLAGDTAPWGQTVTTRQSVLGNTWGVLRLKNKCTH